MCTLFSFFFNLTFFVVLDFKDPAYEPKVLILEFVTCMLCVLKLNKVILNFIRLLYGNEVFYLHTFLCFFIIWD